MVMDGWC